jgi:hypothetical protein
LVSSISESAVAGRQRLFPKKKVLNEVFVVYIAIFSSICLVDCIHILNKWPNYMCFNYNSTLGDCAEEVSLCQISLGMKIKEFEVLE